MDKGEELQELMQAMEKENRMVGSSKPQDGVRGEPESAPLSVQPAVSATAASEGESAASERDSTRQPKSSPRTLVDFSTAQKKSKEQRVAERTRKRGEVTIAPGSVELVYLCWA